ncbi:glycosyltransferase family 2 protein [Granulicella sp. L46]|uniref:glycosyltransferase family 2 protein n=1 Tax=Granulicella sp. L46 TaxID=1641865 RepID=UPI00131E6258|nr:glycosyltransferase family 2 protein [Granulicella sp. L46]
MIGDYAMEGASVVELKSVKAMESGLLDLTIIIPNYNTQELLYQCLQSIYENTCGITFEVFCIDDNSSDGSADMVESFFPQVILVRNRTGQYYAKNNNRGLKESKARYACLLNSDTKLLGNTFQQLVDFMDAHPEAAACGPTLLNPDITVQSCIRRFAGSGTMILQGLNMHKFFPRGKVAREYYSINFDYEKEQVVDSIGTTAYVIRRSTWEQAGMLDERFPHFQVDLAYNLMLKRAGLRVFYTPCAKVIHYGSQSVNQQPKKKIIELHRALADFSDFYNYFGTSWLVKKVVRVALRIRCWIKLLEFQLGSDKRVIKGPGAPPLKRSDLH